MLTEAILDPFHPLQGTKYCQVWSTLVPYTLDLARSSVGAVARGAHDFPITQLAGRPRWGFPPISRVACLTESQQ